MLTMRYQKMAFILWKKVHPFTNKDILGIDKRNIKIDIHKIPI